jgi:hypothetical protein
MPHFCGIAVIVHAVVIISAYASIQKQYYAFVSTARINLPPAALFAVMGIAFPAPPIFFLRKRNKNKDERPANKSQVEISENRAVPKRHTKPSHFAFRD